MNPNELLDKQLPALRADLEVYRGPDEADGSPSYNIYDPLRSIYFKLSWAEIQVLQHLRAGMTLKELMQSLAKDTTLRVKPEEIMALIMQMESQGLIEGYKDPLKLYEKAESEKPNWIKWLVLNYLFIKIPLFNPNEFLERTLKYALPFVSRPAFAIYAFLCLWGFSLVLTRWSEFIHTFTYFFNVGGILAYSIVIVLTKVIHEFAHAYVAKKYGLRIPTMGVAFLVLWPVLYTDATDAWRLHSRRQRMAISGAGVIAELVLAGLATIGWAFSEPGIWQSVCFIVASVNWIATLAINLNPALRFDGYYLLSDWLGVENLQMRAFMVLRYAFYRNIVGADLPDIEPRKSARTKRALIIYAIYTWFYRIFLYTAIALFVYYKFTKVLGVFLFLAEIAIFFLWPIYDEWVFYKKFKAVIKWNWRLKVLLTSTVLFLIWFIVPLPTWVDAPAITAPYHNQTVYAPMAGELKKIYVERGQAVKTGDPILWLRSEELENKIATLEKESAVLEKQLAITQLTDANLEYYMETQLKQAQTNAELEGYKNQKELNLVKAKQDGFIYQWDDFLREGLPVKQSQMIMQIASPDRIDVFAFIPESQAGYLEVGNILSFKPYALEQKYPAEVVSITPVRVQFLKYPQLASTHGGDIPVTQDSPNHQMKIISSYYSVVLKIEGEHQLPYGRTGYIGFWGAWRSRAIWLFEYVFSVVMSESGGF